MTLFNGETDDYSVSSFFVIDENILQELSEINEYWASSYKFYNEIKNKKYTELSKKQQNWLQEIELKHLECYNNF